MTDENRPPTAESPRGAPSAARPVGLTEEQFLQLNRLALQARFVSGMAHELNNSLQVMTGLVELLSDRGDLSADVVTRIQRIGGQADRASGVIRQVLAYTRDQPREMVSVELGSVIERSLALRRYHLGRAGIEVEWERPETRCHVLGDERQLQQVILNLIVNGEEALTGEPQRQLRIALECSQPLARCTVADSGPGVPANLRDRIFEPFFTTRTFDRAIGLGLTASAGIVALHGGRLYLADTTAGATFVLELPVSS